MQNDHCDPQKHHLVCGLTNEFNLVPLAAFSNNRKQNRFVPYRVCGFPAPLYFGDFAEFLVQGEWVVCEFGGKTWWAESNRLGCGSTKGGKKASETNRKNKTGAWFDPELRTERSRKVGLKTAEEKTGVHDPKVRAKTAKRNKELGKERWENGTHHWHLKPTDPGLGGTACFKQQKGAHAPEHRGKGAKTTNTQLWVCTETGKQLPPGPLSNYQKKHNIDTSKRKRLT